MTSWTLTKGLQNLRAQVDAAFPDRSRASDGTIGDKAHQAETSSHNPDDTAGARPEWNGDADSTPEVRAWDCTSDFGPGVDAQAVVDHIRDLPGVSSRIRYMIYNRKIYKAANGWRAEAYTGPSAHTEHIHFTGAFSQAADNDTSFNYRLEEIPVALTAADKTWISGQITAAAKQAAKEVWGTQLVDHADGKSKPADAFLRYQTDVIQNAVNAAVTELDPQLGEIKASLAALKPPASA